MNASGPEIFDSSRLISTVLELGVHYDVEYLWNLAPLNININIYLNTHNGSLTQNEKFHERSKYKQGENHVDNETEEATSDSVTPLPPKWGKYDDSYLQHRYTYNFRAPNVYYVTKL
jgi:hypothetical protein